MRFVASIVWKHPGLLLAAPLLVICILGWRAAPTIKDAAQSDSPPLAMHDRSDWKAAQVDLDFISDASLQCREEEMPAYWRLVGWSLAPWESEVFRPASYSEFINAPNRMRGKPVRLVLNAYRILEVECPSNPHGDGPLYEIWGATDDSRGSLVAVVTSTLPSGVEVGESVHVRLAITGYFLKIQGYIAAGSSPQSTPSTAPLVIGSVHRFIAPVRPWIKEREAWILVGISLVVLSLIGSLIRFTFVRRTNSSATPAPSMADQRMLHQWLEQLHQPS